MSALGDVNKKMYKLYSTLDESSTYPYIISGTNIIGISISNNDQIKFLSIIVEDIKGNTYPIRVSEGKNFDAIIDDVVSVDLDSASDYFDIALFKEG